MASSDHISLLHSNVYNPLLGAPKSGNKPGKAGHDLSIANSSKHKLCFASFYLIEVLDFN